MHIDVSFGAIVTLKNYKTGGGYLHSHWHLYPEGVGAKQQQVIIYKKKKNFKRIIFSWKENIFFLILLWVLILIQ